MSALNIQALDTILFSLKEKRDSYQNFIETGTGLFGETVTNLQPYIPNIVTMDVCIEHYMHFNSIKLNRNFENIHNFYGDSFFLLPGILLALNPANTIFWLTASYNEGDSTVGFKKYPLLNECEFINNFCKSEKCIVMIDDCLKLGKKDDPDRADITDQVIFEKFTNYRVTHEEKFVNLGRPPFWHGNVYVLKLER